MSKKVPDQSLRLNWVYGYRGHQCRSNCHFNEEGHIVYFVAATGIVFSRDHQKQAFYLHHNDDILCLSMHPNKKLAASGETGKDPQINIWDTTTMKTKSVLKKEGTHTHGVGSVGFSTCGSRVLSVGIDPKSLVAIWDWESARQLCIVSGHSDRIFDSCFTPNNDGSFYTVGVKHIKVWNLMGNTLKSKRGVFGDNGSLQTVLCVTRENETGRVLSGTMDGSIYSWEGNNLVKSLPNAAPGPIYSIHSYADGYIAGGKFGCIIMLDNELEITKKIQLGELEAELATSYIRSLSINDDGEILVGTSQSDVLVLNAEHEEITWVTRAHSEGELWGLASHPEEMKAVTASDDKSIRVWDLEAHELSLVAYAEAEARSCCWSPDGSTIAVGFKDGSLKIYSAEDMSEVKAIHDRKQARHCCAFSPSGEFLAVGSNDNKIDIYTVADDYADTAVGAKASSFITQLDWTSDSTHIAACDGAGERLIYNTSGEHVTDSEVLEGLEWATTTGVVGENVDGVFPKYSQLNDVNSVDKRSESDLIATGDDFGLVKLFRYPASKRGAKFRKYNGHSAHVTNVRWTPDGNYLLTTGGADHALFQWKLVGDSESIDEGVEVVEGDDDDIASNSGIDSNSEDSDSSDPDRDVDSDLEAEMEETYSRDLYNEDIIQLKSESTKTEGVSQKRPSAPENSLTLKWCAGYRGHDCRENVKYTQAGEIVFHSAALGIVYNREEHSQRFYYGHTDDILSLTLHPTKDIVATGQIGRNPAIHVWDALTMQTISIFNGVHERGVCALDFTSDGKRLLSVGLSDEHVIAVWDWRRGECVSKVNGSKDKVFCVLSDPHDPLKFVSTGVKHIKFWKIVGASAEGKRGICGSNGETTSHLCGTHGEDEGIFYSGGQNGKIYCWQGNQLQRVVDSHEGPVFTLCKLPEGFLSGGKNGWIYLWDQDMTEKQRDYEVKAENVSEDSHGPLIADNPSIRTIIMGDDFLIAGTKNGELMELDKEGPIKVLVQGHAQGEVWGLATHPEEQVVATISDDKSIRVWDVENQKMTAAKDLGKAGRALTYSPDGSIIVAGFLDGSVMLLEAESLEVVKEFQHRKQNISDVKFDPFGRFVAVGSHENFVDVYSIQKKKRIGICKGSSSYITHVDWTTDGKIIQINSGASERLFYEIPSCKRITPDKATIAKMSWHLWTSVLGPEVEGIWPAYTNVTDINTACTDRDMNIIATGDDFGMVKLFKYPSMEKHAKCKKYTGHSSHITKVRFTAGDSQLVSTGGLDASVMIWQRPESKEVHESDDEDTDDDDDFFDSDVDEEMKIDYDRQTNSDNRREQRRNKGDAAEIELEPIESRTHFARGGDELNFMANFNSEDDNKIDSLGLKHVFGYRGYDARCNLDFQLSATGPDTISRIIYHAAGVAIVQDMETKEQFFYDQHSDDILCLTQNKHPNYRSVVATGQLGGSVHVWNIDDNESTTETLSIISGLPGGVSAVSFSGSGKLILAASLDSEHTVSVYRWQTGQKVSSKCSGPRQIFQADFRPDSDSKFVTVGERALFFWQIAGSVLLCKKAQPGCLNLNQVGTCLSLAFGTDDMTFTGMATGAVIVWQGSNAQRIIERAHNGPVFAMFTTLKDGLIVTGGKEKSSSGAIKLWDSQMKKCKSFHVPIENDAKESVTVKAVARVKGKILVGTKDNAVAVINEKTSEVSMMTMGHFAPGRVNCVCAHPTQANLIASGSSDGSLRVWDVESKMLLQKVHFAAGVTAVRYLNLTDIDDEALICVGLENGEILVLCNERILSKRRDTGKPITFIQNIGNKVAVGQDNNLIFFTIDQENKFKLAKEGFAQGLAASVSSVDFSENEKFAAVALDNDDFVICIVPSAEILDLEDPRIPQLKWQTFHCPRHPLVAPFNSTCATVSTSGKYVAMGDDQGSIQLQEFPPKTMGGMMHYGHGEAVTSICWTCDDKFIISAGGDDQTLFVWEAKTNDE